MFLGFIGIYGSMILLNESGYSFNMTHCQKTLVVYKVKDPKG
jgi:hypothetical protein